MGTLAIDRTTLRTLRFDTQDANRNVLGFEKKPIPEWRDGRDEYMSGPLVYLEGIGAGLL